MAKLNTVSIAWDDQDRPLITVQYADGEGALASPAENPDEALMALAEQLSDKSAHYLRKLLELNEARGAVSLADLASEIGADKKEVDGWNRNLGRSIKKVITREYGFLRPDQEDGTAQVFDFEWDEPNNQWLYIVPTKFRATLILGLDSRK
jgi:hypothetical protein